MQPDIGLIDCKRCHGEGWAWSESLRSEMPCKHCEGTGIDPDSERARAAAIRKGGDNE